MPNLHEELAADLLAFEILRGAAMPQPYSFMARNLMLRLKYPEPDEQREWEFDLLGFVVRENGELDHVDVIEFKLSHQAGRLLRQLRSRQRLGLFRHVMGAWEGPRSKGEAAQAALAEGFGRLDFRLRRSPGGAPSVYIRRCDAPHGNAVGGPMKERFWPTLRGFADAWHTLMDGVSAGYMPCHLCDHEHRGAQLMMPFTTRIINQHAAAGRRPHQHAWFCRRGYSGRRGVVSGVHATDSFIDGEFVGTEVTPGYFIVRDL